MNPNYLDKGNLQVFVTAGELPVPGAQVRISDPQDGAVLMEDVTDASGQTSFIELPAPPMEWSVMEGRRVQCKGLSQWGSQALAEQGWDVMDILRKYYGSEIYLKSAGKVEGVPLSYGGQVLSPGSQGEAVRTIQEQLNRIARNFPAIPKIPADGR